MRFFVPITKVDVEKREVWGQATAERPDKVREMFDYESSIPLFRNWSAAFEKATEGLPEQSLGNIRAMHGKVAAGKVIAFMPDDAAKEINIGTKIVDDNEWQKCLSGTYTGFSIGGSYVKKWKDPVDPTITRYTASPTEISLVDNPCLDSALFSMVKADGVTETRPFQKYGLLKAAIEREGLTVGELLTLAKDYLPTETLEKSDASVKDIVGELRALIADAPVSTALAKSEPDAAPAADANTPAIPAAPAAPAAAVDAPAAKVFTHLRKGMYSVQSFASILQSLAWLAQDLEAEKQWENDASAVPADLRTAIQLLCEIFKKMSAEETDEMLASIIPDGVVIEVLELAAKTGDIAKAGKRHSKADTDMIQAVHDHSVGLGADCSAAAAKSVAADAGAIAKGTATTATTASTDASALDKAAGLEKVVADLTAERDALAKHVKELEALPVAGKGVVRVVEKTADGAAITKTDDDALKPNPKDPIAVMKAVHATGGRPIRL